MKHIKPSKLIPVIIAFLLLSLFLLFSLGVSAQTGPGGIGQTDGTSTLSLWLDANQITNVSNLNNITTWADQSGNTNDATQSTASRKPNFFSNILNGHPIVNFSGTEDLDGNFGGPFVGSATFFAVAMFNNDQGLTDDDHVFSIGQQNTDGRMVSISRRRNDGNQNNYYCEDGDNNNYGPNLATSQWYIFSQTMNTSSPELSLNLDGTSQTVDDFYNTSLNTNGVYRIGNWSDAPNNEYLLDGQIAEMIVFNDVLSVVERNIVESFLSAKYDINIDVASDKYVGDDLGNGDFDRDVIGIGFESSTTHNSSKSSGLSIEQSSSFTDGDYVLAGHKVLVNSINTVDASDAGATLEARWDRQWFVDLTDADNSTRTTISFDFSDGDLGLSPAGTTTNYKLLFRSTSSGNWTLMVDVAALSGDIVTFSGVDLSTNGDGYYTLGTIDQTNSPIGTEPIVLGNNGPGGIGSQDGASSLELWLNAGDISGGTNDPVLTWTDKSGNDNSASQGTDFPFLATSVLNGNNALSFDGTNDFMSGSITGGLAAPSSIISVAYFDQLNQGTDNDYVISIGASSIAGDHTSISRRNNTGTDDDEYYSWDGANARVTTEATTITGQAWTVISQTQDVSVTRHAAYLNGTAISVDDYVGNFSSTGNYNVGRWVLSANSFLAGDIAELMVYSTKLNSAELNIIHSYLGAKYNLALAGDKYVGDDLGNGDHDLDIAGVGTESDGGNTLASSAGMNIVQNSGFENGDYVMVGHKTAINSWNTSDIMDAGATLESRWERTWWIDITDASTVLSVNITFDYSSAEISIFPDGTASNYKVIFRTGTSGNWTILASGNSITGDQILFSNVSISTDGYYGIATIDEFSSPLPVELFSFSHRIENQSIVLEWSTATELNNDRFEILKSIDGKEFELIGSRLGSGTSQQIVNYEFSDSNPVNGANYYKLNQVDFDGTQEPSKTLVAFFEVQDNFFVYPNPVANEVNVFLGDKFKRTDTEIVIFNISGSEIYRVFLNVDNSSIKLPISSLSSGVYFIRVANRMFRSEQRIVVNQ